MVVVVRSELEMMVVVRSEMLVVVRSELEMTAVVRSEMLVVVCSELEMTVLRSEMVVVLSEKPACLPAFVQICSFSVSCNNIDPRSLTTISTKSDGMAIMAIKPSGKVCL